MAIQSSASLEVGQVYTRAQLKDMFEIIDLTINTGVFRPKGHDSVWLFVTEQKTKDRTPYRDYQSGSLLEWDGQTSARTDALVIEHRERNLEVLLFYRKSKREHEGAGFRYHGRVFYEVHIPGKPSHFLLKLETPIDPQDRGDEVRTRFRALGEPSRSPSLDATTTIAVRAADLPWLQRLPDEGTRSVFVHLSEHGSVTEMELVHLLGSTRQARRFANRLDEWLAFIPFAVRAEATAAGKRYVRVGRA